MNAPLDSRVRAGVLSTAAPNSPDRDDVGAIIDALRVITHEIRLAGGAAEDRTGMTAAELGILRRLVAFGPMSLTKLAALKHKDISTVSVMVKRLVHEGFVARKVRVADRRGQTLALTARGRAAARRAPEPEVELVARAASELTAHEVERLADGLSKLATELSRR